MGAEETEENAQRLDANGCDKYSEQPQYGEESVIIIPPVREAAEV